jgi:hypothetical protein
VSAPARAIAAIRRAEIPSRIVGFFTAPTDGSAAGVFRIAFGLLSLSNVAWVALNLERWFSEGGVTMMRLGHPRSSIFGFAPDASWMGWLHAGGLGLGSLLLILGLFPRLGAFLVFLLHTSLQHRTPMILNSGDRLFAIIAFLAMFAPLGHRFGLESLWRARRGRPAPPATLVGQRLIQIQIAYVYANTSISKAMNERWIHGRAMRDVLASPVFAEWPTWIDFWPLVFAMTWGALAFELSFPTLVWFRRFRPWLLLAGVGFHLMIDVLMIIPMFSWIMIVSYAAFLDDDLVRRALARLGIARPPADAAPAPV